MLLLNKMGIVKHSEFQKIAEEIQEEIQIETILDNFQSLHYLSLKE